MTPISPISTLAEPSWWKFIYDTKAPHWSAYGRVAFVQAGDEVAAHAAALVAAQAEYPGAEILPHAIGQSTPAAAAAYFEQRRRLAEWQRRTMTGEPNQREDLDVSTTPKMETERDERGGYKVLVTKSKQVQIEELQAALAAAEARVQEAEQQRDEWKAVVVPKGGCFTAAWAKEFLDYGMKHMTAELAAERALEKIVQYVVASFKADEAQGYRSKDRRFAIELFEKFLPALPAGVQAPTIEELRDALSTPPASPAPSANDLQRPAGGAGGGTDARNAGASRSTGPITDVVYSSTYGDPNWMPPQLVRAIEGWKAANFCGDFYHGLFPLGLVQGLIEQVTRLKEQRHALHDELSMRDLRDSGGLPEALGDLPRAEPPPDPEIARLRAQIAELEKDAAYHSECRPNRRQAEAWRDLAQATNDKWADEVKARRELEAQIATLTTALRTYGQHRHQCALRQPQRAFTGIGSSFSDQLPPADAVCNCGLSASLAALPVTRPPDVSDDDHDDAGSPGSTATKG